MRSEDRSCGGVFSYIDLQARVSAEHPLRAIREIMSAALAALSGGFASLYSGLGGHRSRGKAAAGNAVAGLVSVRSERQLMEPIEFDLLFRWFVGIGIDDPV
jgi:hypothetical protein